MEMGGWREIFFSKIRGHGGKLPGKIPR